MATLLWRYFDDFDPELRRLAAWRLGELAADDAAVRAQLRDALRSDSEERRVAAADALGACGVPSELPALRARLEDSSPHVRAAAARALGELGDNDAFLPLLERLWEPDGAVRGAALDALVTLRAPGTFETLSRYLSREPDPDARCALRETLGRLGDLELCGAPAL